MKYRLFLIIATFAVLGSTITSCSWDDELRVATNDGDQTTPISFNVNFGSIPDPEVSSITGDSGESSTTRGAAGQNGKKYQFDDGDLIKIAVKAPASPTHPTSRLTSEDVKTYKVESSVLSQDETYYISTLEYDGALKDAFQWLSRSEEVLIRAWSSGNTTSPTDPRTYVTATPFVLTTNQSSGYNEVLYSPEDSYSFGSDGSVSIPLYHQLARVMITVSEDGGSTSSKTVTIGDGTMLLPKTATFADPDPASNHFGTWTVANDNAEKVTITPFVESENIKFSAVLIPKTYAAGGNFINIKIGDTETFHYVIPDGGITLEAGKQYNFDIKVKNRAITFTVSVTAWASETRPIDFTE